METHTQTNTSLHTSFADALKAFLLLSGVVLQSLQVHQGAPVIHKFSTSALPSSTKAFCNFHCSDCLEISVFYLQTKHLHTHAHNVLHVLPRDKYRSLLPFWVPAYNFVQLQFSFFVSLMLLPKRQQISSKEFCTVLQRLKQCIPRIHLLHTARIK